MKKNKVILVCLLFFTFIDLSKAIELTLKECINLAFENNPALKSKLAELESAKYSYYSSLNSYLPKINLSNNFSRSGGDNNQTSNTFSLSASVSQNIFDYDSIYTIKSSRINYEIAQLNYESYLIDLRKNIYTAFYNLLFAQETYRVNEKIVEIRKNNADLIKLKYQSGFESKGNMLYAVAQYEMARLNLDKSKRQIEIASNNLKNAIGIKIKDEILVRENISMPQILFERDKIIDYIKSTPAYKIFEKNILLAEEKLKTNKYDWLPKLSFSASRGYSGKSEFPDTNMTWSIGLGLSFPLFSSGITYYKNNVDMLKETLRSTREKLNAYIISAENDIQNAYNEYLNSVSTVKTYAILLEANEERYKEAQIKYMAGKMSYIDLENIEQNLVDSRQNYTEYIKNVYLRKISLESLIGEKISQ
ncbi:MAG: TolC family protein [Elusimicrobiota bacterium]